MSTHDKLRDLVQCLLDNDPADCAADGVTVLEVWREEARAELAAGVEVFCCVLGERCYCIADEGRRERCGNWRKTRPADGADLRTALRETLAGGITDETMAAVKKNVDQIMCDIEGQLQYQVKDDLAPHLVSWVVDMAKRTVEAILAGDEGQMRRYLGCERGLWTGREADAPQVAGMRKRAAHEWHQVIHGKLFEQGAVALRRKVVDAHRELLTSQRVLDLEDQVRSLVEQVNKLGREKKALEQRLRDEVRTY